jgi:general secretion pathway protein K
MLWMIAILAILSVSIGQHVRQKISLADRIERRNWLVGIAETGVFQTLSKLRMKKEADQAYHSSNDTYVGGKRDFLNVAVGEGTYTVSYSYRDAKAGELKNHYGVEDEEGKININVLDAKVLSTFFQKAGEIEQELADEISYSVVDWRDTDNSLSHPEYGAENDYYEGLESPYEAKDYKFESIEELLLVRGMTPELFEKVKPFVTIYGTGVVNINTAPREVLAGLGMEDDLADKIMLFRTGADLEQGTPDDNVFTQLGNWDAELGKRVKMTDNDISLLNQIVATERLGINSLNFRIRSLGAIPRKQQALEMDVVADIEGKILSWSTGVPRRMTPAELVQAAKKSQNA